jgi:glycogen synthase
VTGAKAGLAGVRICILRRGSIEHDKRAQQIARLLTEVGAEVTVVATSGVERTYRTPSGFTVRELASTPPSEHRVWLFRVASNLTRNRLRAWLLRRAVVRAAREARPDLVHCMNVEMLALGHRAAGDGRFLYDSREHFATTGAPSERVRREWMRAERRFMPQAAAVITVTDMIADDLERRYGIPRPAVLVNGCTTHVNAAQPVHTPLRLIHQGKFFFDRHLADVIKAVVRQEGRAVLTLQGWGEAEDSLRALAAELGAGELVTFVPPVPPEEVVASASEHDVGIINIWPENESHRWTGSNKLFDYMGAGLAELVTNLDFTRRIVEAEGIGRVFDPPDVDQIADAIAWLVENPDEVTRMKRNAVAAAPKYTWDAQAETLYAVYEQALEDTRSRRSSDDRRPRI